MKKFVTLFLAMFFSAGAFAQIPNGGFELWDTSVTPAYLSPKNWDNLNSTTSAVSVYTCQRDSPSVGLNYYVKLTSKTTPLGVAPGVIVSGKIDIATYSAKSGFPFTGRPKSLIGEWQYMASGADQGHVAVLLTKWNLTKLKRDTISFTDHLLVGMEMSWKPFTIDLKYQMAGNPDSAIIVLSSSGATAVAGSYLYVDTLAFKGSVLSAPVMATAPALLSIYPNPATESATIVYSSSNEQAVNISISDVNGRVLKTITSTVKQGENKTTIQTSGFAPGVYFIRLVTETGTEEKKLIIQ
jgi:hypothetical protein